MGAEVNQGVSKAEIASDTACPRNDMGAPIGPKSHCEPRSGEAISPFASRLPPPASLSVDIY